MRGTWEALSACDDDDKEEEGGEEEEVASVIPLAAFEAVHGERMGEGTHKALQGWRGIGDVAKHLWAGVKSATVKEDLLGRGVSKGLNTESQ